MVKTRLTPPSSTSHPGRPRRGRSGLRSAKGTFRLRALKSGNDLFRWGLPYYLLQQQNAHLKDGSAHADQAAQFPSPACVRDAPIRAIPGKPFRAWRAGRAGGAMSAFDGTFRTRIDVRLESVMRFKADIGGQPTDQFNEEISAPH
jgi:hypothetical protein